MRMSSLAALSRSFSKQRHGRGVEEGVDPQVGGRVVSVDEDEVIAGNPGQG
jgi:hypothetical protein